MEPKVVETVVFGMGIQETELGNDWATIGRTTGVCDIHHVLLMSRINGVSRSGQHLT